MEHYIHKPISGIMAGRIVRTFIGPADKLPKIGREKIIIVGDSRCYISRNELTGKGWLCHGPESAVNEVTQ